MKSDALVLLVGKDEALLQTRKLILGSYFQVDVAGRISHAAQLISERSFDLIVLCSTLSDDECERATEHAAARTPRPKLLTLRAKGREILSHGTDNELIEEVGPMILARKIAAMLGLDIRANGRGISEVRLVGID